MRTTCGLNGLCDLLGDRASSVAAMRAKKAKPHEEAWLFEIRPVTNAQGNVLVATLN
jgi:hypothetical protein